MLISLLPGTVQWPEAEVINKKSDWRQTLMQLWTARAVCYAEAPHLANLWLPSLFIISPWENPLPWVPAPTKFWWLPKLFPLIIWSWLSGLSFHLFPDIFPSRSHRDWNLARLKEAWEAGIFLTPHRSAPPLYIPTSAYGPPLWGGRARDLRIIQAGSLPTSKCYTLPYCFDF